MPVHSLPRRVVRADERLGRLGERRQRERLGRLFGHASTTRSTTRVRRGIAQVVPYVSHGIVSEYGVTKGT